ncbi:MAG: outer membrane beta-barrel family protein, partial [Prevotella sp.]|nr:outer membrane beta-barrel family protein [Prevotella sp.]
WLMIDYGVGYWRGQRMHDVTNSYEYADYTKRTDNESWQKSDYVSQNLETNIFINDKMNAGFMASFDYMDEDLTSDVRQTLSGVKEGLSSENTRSDVGYKNFYIAPYYEWTIDSLGKKLTVNYCYNRERNKSVSDYLSDDYLEVANSLSDNHYYVNTLNLYLTLPFTFLNFEAGGEYKHYRADNNARYNAAENFRYKETVAAFYADINKDWKRIYFKLGIRYEHTKSEGLPDEESDSFRKSYGDWFPFAELTYKPGGNNVLYFGYSKRINRPDMLQLNPTRVYTDAYSYSAGNPLLTPSLPDYLELRYQHKALNVSLSYTHTSDGVGLLINDKETSTEGTYSNCITTNSLAGNVNYNYSYKRFNAQAQIGLTYNNFKSTDKTITGSPDGLSSFIAVNLAYMAGKKILTYAGYMYYFAGQEQYVRYKPMQNLSLGANWMIVPDKLTLTANVNDLLGKQYNRNRIVYAGFVFHNRNDYDNRSLNIKLTYKFGNKRVKRSYVDINTSDGRLPGAER